jgi:UDP-N-acetylglucosamine diphosphorylase/glucosamine-1-phosphate N-acetyltransferase
VVAHAQLPTDEPRVLLSSRVALEWGTPALSAAEPATFTIGGQVVGWALPPGARAPDEQTLVSPDDGSPAGRAVELRGTLLEWPWSLVEANPERTLEDLVALHRGSGGETRRPPVAADASALAGVHVLGGHPVLVGEGAAVEAGVVIDAREGPVHIGAGTRVQGPARIAGPLHVGAGSVVFGGAVGHSSIGPMCKVRGEIDTSVLCGYCNKAHDGYLGHALLGAWVNLGALTTNSDLKNNYSPVRVRLRDAEVDSGLLKVGSFLGDHVKTGIGTLLNTGAVVGAGSNLFGGRMPPKYVPPFSWGTGDDLVEFRLEKFFEVAEAAMKRRNVTLTSPMREMLGRAWERTRGERG